MASDHCCPWWWAYSFDNPLRRLFQDPDQVMGSRVLPGMSALDLGCGMGYYSIALARRVGPEGRVIAVDLQERMLAANRRRAERAGVASRIEYRRCGKDDLRLGDLAGQLDYAIAMWMVHEVPDRERFLAQVAAALRPGAFFLVAEPRLHVSREDLARTISLADKAGLTLHERPRVGLSRTALLRRNPSP